MKALDKVSVHMIDDDEMFLTALQHYLQGALNGQIKTKCFHTGEEFLKNLPAEKPDVIILDHFLNSRAPFAMDGMSVLQKIKQLNPKIPVIILSGQNRIEVALNSLKSGAYDYVIKNDNAFLKIRNMLKSRLKSSGFLKIQDSMLSWPILVISFALLASLTLIMFNLFHL